MERLMLFILAIWILIAPWILLLGSPPVTNHDIDQDYAIQYVAIRWLVGVGIIFIGSLILRCWGVPIALLAMWLGFEKMNRMAHQEWLESEHLKAMKGVR